MKVELVGGPKHWGITLLNMLPNYCWDTDLCLLYPLHAPVGEEAKKSIMGLYLFELEFLMDDNSYGTNDCSCTKPVEL